MYPNQFPPMPSKDNRPPWGERPPMPPMPPQEWCPPQFPPPAPMPAFAPAQFPPAPQGFAPVPPQSFMPAGAGMPQPAMPPFMPMIPAGATVAPQTYPTSQVTYVYVPYVAPMVPPFDQAPRSYPGGSRPEKHYGKPGSHGPRPDGEYGRRSEGRYGRHPKPLNSRQEGHYGHPESQLSPDREINLEQTTTYIDDEITNSDNSKDKTKNEK